MFCSVCGKETLAGSQFCGGCGAGIAPSLQATDSPQASVPKQVALWNPYAIWLWSLLFGTAFGSFLHAKNWQSLEQSDKAKTQYVWFIAGCVASFFAIVGVYFFVDDQARGYRVGTGVQLITLMAWYFLSARHQDDFIKKTYLGNYQRRPWLGPISIAATSVILLAFASELLHPSETEKPSRPTVSSEVAVEPAAGIEELQRPTISSEVKTASIDRVVVDSAAQEFEKQDTAGAAAEAAEQAWRVRNGASENASAAVDIDGEASIAALAEAAGEGEPQAPRGELSKSRIDDCEEILSTGLYNGIVEESCDFNGGVNRGLMNLFDAKECRDVIPQKRFDQISGDVFNETKQRYKAMGQAAFCKGNLDAYNKLIDVLEEITGSQ